MCVCRLLVPQSPSSINLVLEQAGKITTVVMASHWLCVTDSGLFTYRLNGLRQRKDHPTCAPLGPGTLIFLRLLVSMLLIQKFSGTVGPNL